MSSPIPYEFDDHDIVSPDYSVALLARYPLARLGRQFAPVDADDCAPGLETRNGWPAAVVAPSNEHDGFRWFAARCYSDGETGMIFCFATEAGALTCAAGLMSDVDTDPRGVQDDDCAAGYRRSNDSGDGGTP